MASLSRDELNALLRRSFDAAVAAADPMKIVAPHLPDVPPRGRTLVVGAGKAAASMAAAVEAVWPPGAGLSGIVITRYGHGLPLQRIRCIEAGHPVPDQAGEHAAQEILEQVSGLSGDDHLIVLISGGGVEPFVAARRWYSHRGSKGIDPGPIEVWRTDYRYEHRAQTSLEDSRRKTCPGVPGTRDRIGDF